jgi:hypothetical protein
LSSKCPWFCRRTLPSKGLCRRRAFATSKSLLF